MTAATTDDAVLGGHLTLRQPRRGHRVGHDAILLAAATGARAGEHAVEFGAGVGAAGLALARRVSGLHVSLIEIDPYLCALASGNALRNDVSARTICADVVRLPLRPDTADRVLMNPPFNQARRHNASPDPQRRRAHVGDSDLLSAWIDAAAFILRDGGMLTLIWRADDLDAVLAALAGRFGAATILPVLPREDAAAIRVLVRAVKGAAWARSDLAPLALNDASGRPTDEAEAVMRHAATLALGEPA